MFSPFHFHSCSAAFRVKNITIIGVRAARDEVQRFSSSTKLYTVFLILGQVRARQGKARLVVLVLPTVDDRRHFVRLVVVVDARHLQLHVAPPFGDDWSCRRLHRESTAGLAGGSPQTDRFVRTLITTSLPHVKVTVFVTVTHRALSSRHHTTPLAPPLGHTMSSRCCTHVLYC